MSNFVATDVYSLFKKSGKIRVQKEGVFKGFLNNVKKAALLAEEGFPKVLLSIGVIATVTKQNHWISIINRVFSLSTVA